MYAGWPCANYGTEHIQIRHSQWMLKFCSSVMMPILALYNPPKHQLASAPMGWRAPTLALANGRWITHP